MCFQEKKKIVTIEQTGRCNISSFYYTSHNKYPIYFFVYMRKEAPVNRIDTFPFFRLDYLHRDQWIEIIRMSHPALSNLHPINPVYRVETIQINTNKEYIFQTLSAYQKDRLVQKYIQFLLYFNFSQKSTAVQEINFLVDICIYDVEPVYVQGYPKTHYQFYQKYVQLFSYEPGYLISTIIYVDTITINNVNGSRDGAFKAYITAAPHLESQEGSRYNMCSTYYICLNECVLQYQGSARLYIYYVDHKYRSI